MYNKYFLALALDSAVILGGVFSFFRKKKQKQKKKKKTYVVGIRALALLPS